MLLCGYSGNQLINPNVNSCFIFLQELLSRTNLETHKLDLMAENSSLKLRVASMDKDRQEVEEKYTFAQVRTSNIMHYFQHFHNATDEQGQ